MSLLASDPFTGNAANLGVNWTDIDAGMRIVSNEATSGAADNIYSSRYTGVSAPAAQYSEVDVGSTVSASTDEGGGPGVRLQSGGDMYFLQGNTHETRNYKRVSGGYTQLGSDGGATASTDVLYYEAQGSTLVTKKNTVAICGSPVSDSSIGSGDFGVWSTHSGGGATSFNNWRGGDFSGGTQSFSYAASGGLTFAGSASELRLRTLAAAGGLSFAGSAAELRKHVIAAAGGLAFAGASSQLRKTAVAAAGGLVFAGAAPESSHEAARIVAAAGGLNFGGSSSMSSFTSGVVGSDFIIRRRRRV